MLLGMDTEPRREAFSLAVNQYLPRGKQRAIADELGIPPTTLSGWVKGRRTPSNDEAIQLEEVLELEPGTLTVHLGFLPLGAREVNIASVEEAVIADARLGGDQKRIVLDLIRSMVRSNE